jgi:hypothetical protein
MLENIFLLKRLTKLIIKINIIAYFCLIKEYNMIYSCVFLFEVW